MKQDRSFVFNFVMCGGGGGLRAVDSNKKTIQFDLERPIPTVSTAVAAVM
jgi:hypothetical protein